jgi:hypothetical protein
MCAKLNESIILSQQILADELDTLEPFIRQRWFEMRH